MMSLFRSTRAVATIAAGSALSLTIAGGVAVAFWTTTDGSNPGAATATTLPTGATPTALLSGLAATVSFNQVSTSPASGAVPLTSYRISRYSSAAATTPVSTATCTPTLVGSLATCVQPGLTVGSWWFTDTPLLANWVGGESAKTSSAVTVSSSFTIAPSQSVGSLPGTLTGGSLVGFSPNESVTFRLDGPTGAVLTASISAVGAGGTASGFTVALPAGLLAADGSHTIVAIGSSSGAQATSNSFTLALPATLTLSGSTTLASLPGTLTGALAHFKASESVRFALDSASGPALTVNGGASSTVDVVGAVSGLVLAVPAGIAQGSHTIVAVGAAGSTAVASFTVSVSGALSFSNAAITLVSSVLATGQVTSLHATSTVTFHLDSAGGALLTVTGGTTSTSVTTDANGAASGFTVSPGALASQGAHTVWAVDASGSSASYAFTIDTVAPSTTDNTAAFGSAWSTVSRTVVLTANDATSGVAATYYTTDGSTPTTSSTLYNAATGIVLSSDGAFVVKYFSVDLVGNAETVRISSTVRIDRTAPALSAVAVGLTSGSNVGYLGQGVSATVYAAVSDPASGVGSVTAALPAGLTASTSVTLTALATPVTIGGVTYNYTGSFTTNTTIAGTSYSFTVTATDVAGNVGTKSGTVNTNDRTAPTGLTVTTPTSNGTYSGVFAGTAGTDVSGSGDQTTIFVQITDRSTSRLVWSGTAVVSAGAWTFVGPALPSAPYTLTVTQSDNAGNTTTVNSNFRV
jgi:hypothetical protein